MQGNRICCIFAGGPETELPCLPIPNNAYVLCADSGLQLALRLGQTPDLVLGDFDSLHDTAALQSLPPHCRIITAPAEKDDTDTMLAVRNALAAGYRDVRIYGAFGGRLDHTIANIQTLRFLTAHGAQGMLIGARDYICLQGTGTRTYPHREGFTFSVFSLTEQSTGVTLRGTYYPLTNATLTPAFPIGISNRITAAYAEVTCEEGLLLVMGSREEAIH